MSKKSQPDYLKHMADDCLGFRLRRLNRMVSTFYDEGLRPYKAKISQMNLLIIIGMNQQITPSQLGQYAQAEASTLSRNIDRM
ncbi:MAG: MarR family transcriptional regulator, partial [Gammaproteobacteria bacterium]|nr:MarR family transcriptional regulator [Gammaproteobacteria bacterium]NIO63602.1 MarR family transcriptional regulator [Gammaproteobacteria bacterium]